jgi:hypothetical protein
MTNDNTESNSNEASINEIKKRIIRLALDKRSPDSFKREIHSICRQLDTVTNPRTAIRLILSFFDVQCRSFCCISCGKIPPSVLYWGEMEKRFADLIKQCDVEDQDWIIEQFMEIIGRQNLVFVHIFEHCNKFLPKETMECLGAELMERYLASEFAQSDKDVMVSVVVSRLAENLNDAEMFYAARRYGQQGQLQILDYADLLALLVRSDKFGQALGTAETVVEAFASQNPATVMFMAAMLQKENLLLSVFIRQKLVTYLLNVGTKQALENAANQLVWIDEDAPKIKDWMLVEPQERFVSRLHTEHGNKDIFWNSYKGGTNKNIEGYHLDIYVG